MPRVKVLRISIILMLLIVAGQFIGLGGQRQAGADEPRPILVIFPFVVEKIEDPSRGAVCPICQGVHRSSEVPPGASSALTMDLYAKLAEKDMFIIPPFEEVREALSRFGQRQFEEEIASSSIQLGRSLKADFALVGIVFRYKERMGSSLGVQEPASVSFELHLFRLRDGRRVWDANLDETQEALFDDLLRAGAFLRGKAKWITAEDLAVSGMAELLKKLPGVKELQEKP